MKKILLIVCLLIINITPVLAESNAYLSSLSVEGYKLSPEFDKNNNTYSVTINEDVTKLDLKYTLEDALSEVEILDNDLITEDNHVVTINVKNNEEIQTYKIIVNKSKEDNVASINNDSLELNIPKHINMKLIASLLIIGWLLFTLILRRIMFGRLRKVK